MQKQVSGGIKRRKEKGWDQAGAADRTPAQEGSAPGDLEFTLA